MTTWAQKAGMQQKMRHGVRAWPISFWQCLCKVRRDEKDHLRHPQEGRDRVGRRLCFYTDTCSCLTDFRLSYEKGGSSIMPRNLGSEPLFVIYLQ